MTTNIQEKFHEVPGGVPAEEIIRLVLTKYNFYVWKILKDLSSGILTTEERNKIIKPVGDVPPLEDYAFTDEGISDLHKCGMFSKSQYLDCYSEYRYHDEHLNHGEAFNEYKCLNKFEYVILTMHMTTINAYRDMDSIDWLPLSKKHESLQHGRVTIYPLYLHYREKHIGNDNISSTQERQCIMNFAKKYVPVYLETEVNEVGPLGPIFNALTMFMKYRGSEKQETIDVEELKLYLILRCIKLTLYKIRTVPGQLVAVFCAADMAAYYNALDEVEQ